MQNFTHLTNAGKRSTGGWKYHYGGSAEVQLRVSRTEGYLLFRGYAAATV